jgi:acetoacetyl-CoA synthetase
MTQPLWSPSAARVAKARLTRFIAGLGEPAVSDYPSLYAWSIEDPESFWAAVWRFCGVVSGQRWARVLEGGDRMPGARWFPGATLNFAENLMGAADLRPALVFRAESGERRELSPVELHREVARLAAGLRAAGVGVGDRVAGYLPNVPETVLCHAGHKATGDQAAVNRWLPVRTPSRTSSSRTQLRTAP